MYPVELILIIVSYLPPRDIVVLGHTCRSLQIIAEEERKKRLDIDRFLSRYVKDTDGFRRLMRETGAIIVGDLARAFFTGDDHKEQELELLFGDVDITPRLQSWTSFLGIDATDIMQSSRYLYERYRRQSEEVSFSMVQSFSPPPKVTKTRPSDCLAIAIDIKCSEKIAPFPCDCNF
jgi:hypothetical protein